MTIDITHKQYWQDNSGNEYSEEFITKEVNDYVSVGGKIYVGADSMLLSNSCNFAAVIAMHDRGNNIAKYYFKRFKEKSKNYKVLQVKILEEVMLAIQTAQHVVSICPDAKIELHIDIGSTKKNETSKMVNLVKGWVLGTGFKYKIKPHSWASSSLADWHTKK
jgi:uncharacterized protein